MLSFLINSTAIASEVHASGAAIADVLRCANATLAAAAGDRRSVTRVLELLASRGGPLLPANEAFVAVEVAAAGYPQPDTCPSPDVETVVLSMLESALDSAAESDSAGSAAVQASLERGASGEQVLYWTVLGLDGPG